MFPDPYDWLKLSSSLISVSVFRSTKKHVLSLMHPLLMHPYKWIYQVLFWTCWSIMFFQRHPSCFVFTYDLWQLHLFSLEPEKQRYSDVHPRSQCFDAATIKLKMFPKCWLNVKIFLWFLEINRVCLMEMWKVLSVSNVENVLIFSKILNDLALGTYCIV